jgi:uncharacterized C2H2 Zn-finger protein
MRADVICLFRKIADLKKSICYNAFVRSKGDQQMASDTMDAVRKYFTVEDAPRQKNKWLIVCPKCDAMWHLDKDNKHPGNVLHLLNHARGHDVKRPRNV